MSKFCTNCGTELEDDAVFCTNCAAKQAQAPQDADATMPLDAAGEGAAPELSGLDTMVTEAMPAAPAAAPASAPAAQPTAVMPPVTPAQGQPATFYSADQLSQQQQPGNKKPVIIGAIAVVAVLIVALLVAFFVLSEHKDAEPAATPAASQNAQDTAAQVYSVTYETGGGSTISVAQVQAGDTITSPVDPTRTGYTFGGWFLDPSYTRPVAFPYKVEGDTVLYAKWTPTASSGAATPPASDQAPSAPSAGGNAFTVSNVELTVVGADGTSRSGTIHRQGATGRVFPDSNTRKLTSSEISALSDAERCVAWNEIIAAASGYEFKNSGLSSYFNDHCAWYAPNAGGSGSVSGVAGENVRSLQAATSDWWQHLAS